MDDFTSLEKQLIRELSCRLCLCTDIIKLKPLNAETKRKIKKIFNIIVSNDDILPKAICHDCMQQLNTMYLYTVKVEKTQKFLEFYKAKTVKDKIETEKSHPIVSALTEIKTLEAEETNNLKSSKVKDSSIEHYQGDVKENKAIISYEIKSLPDPKSSEPAIKDCITNNDQNNTINNVKKKIEKYKIKTQRNTEHLKDFPDPIILLDGKPAKEGTDLDRQITLFYHMECNICHDTGFSFRDLMKHYRDKHGVPGYVTCCNRKFHYFYPKRLIEHMAYHLQPNIFMCESCHKNFETSHELQEHQSNGGRTKGKILCPRCPECYPTYKELGCHIITHRDDQLQCDYCGKILKHHHHKRTVNRMEDLYLCSLCMRTLKNTEKQEKIIKEQMRTKQSSANKKARKKYQRFRQAMGLSPDEESSTESP